MWGLGIEPAPFRGALNYRAISPASRYQFLLVFPQKILMETLEHNITQLASTRENWVLKAKCDLGSVDSSHCRLTSFMSPRKGKCQVNRHQIYQHRFFHGK